MKLTAATAIFSLVAAANAAPPAPEGMTVKEASSKCGNQAQLSCCNDVTYAGDSTTIQKGVASGILSGLLGQGSGAKGIGAFTGCSKLDVAVVGVQDILNKKCQQNVACCDFSGASANGDLVGAALPCVALGSVA